MTELKEILEWAQKQPWAHAMSKCPQDDKWHGEGDVWTHTEMVCECLSKDPDFLALDSESKRLLGYAAVLHDVGKPEVTKHGNDASINSFKHSLSGEKAVRRILMSEGMEFPLREKICRLVRYHGYPLSIRFKDDPDAHVIWSSCLVDNNFLYILAKADANGRISDSLADLLTWLELWRETTERLQCFDRPFDFTNDDARVLFYNRKLSNVFFTPHSLNQFEVTMLSGLPGSGKTRWRNEILPLLPVVELDNVRKKLNIRANGNQGSVIQEARELCRRHLREKRAFVFDATNITKRTRKRWLQLFYDYGARVKIVYIEKTIKLIRERNRTRKDSVPDKVLDKLLLKLEPPDWSEAHEIAFHCD